MSETSQRSKSQWRPILPVPEGTAAARFSHPNRGDPSRIFEYRDMSGAVLGYMCRFIKSTGGAIDLARTFCVNEADQSTAWRWIQFTKLRPMYGAEQLEPDVPQLVVIVQDEFTAMELRNVEEFKHLTFVSWPGGRKKIGEVDWSPLKSKLVVIWLPHSAERFKVAKDDPQSGELLPLHKQPWRVAAARLAETIKEYHAMPMGIVAAETTEELPDGWSPVRALDEKWTGKQLLEWYQQHLGSDAERALASALAGAPDAPAPTGDPADWKQALIRDPNTQAILAELSNVYLILGNHHKWKGVIYFDDFAHSVMKAAPPPFEKSEAGEWRDHDDSMTAVWFATEVGVRKLRTPLVAEGVQTMAQQQKRNPLKEYLLGLKWDGTKRIGTWLIDCLGAGPFTEDMSQGDIERLQIYLRLVGGYWLMGAVKRALQPGCKFDYVLILEGMQGLGKSSALAVLGGEWAMDTPFALGDKEGMETIRGKWIIEIPELDSFHKAESNMAKSFFARQADDFRLPYARRSQKFKRTCVFGGTTNQLEDYLRDPTGNRRYWPVLTNRKGFDQERLKRDRDQLFAEAVALVLAGGRYWPTLKEEQLYIQPEQRKREILDPWTSAIAAWLKSADSELGPITRIRILREALKIDAARLDEKGMATRVGAAMRKLGYRRIEDKSLPDRFRYEKRQSSEEGDDDERS